MTKRRLLTLLAAVAATVTGVLALSGPASAGGDHRPPPCKYECPPPPCEYRCPTVPPTTVPTTVPVPTTIVAPTTTGAPRTTTTAPAPTTTTTAPVPEPEPTPAPVAPMAVRVQPSFTG